MWKSILAALALCIAGAGCGPGVQAGAAPAVQAPAPEFTGIERWFNSAPLTMQGLKGRVVLVGEDDRGTHDPVERAPGGLEDRLDVGEALPGLLLDGAGHDRAGGGIDRRSAGDEHEASRLHGLAVGRWRPRGRRR